MYNDRILPNDIEAEKAFLSTIMNDSNFRSKLEFSLKKFMFYKTEHKYIFNAIENLDKKDVEADIVTLFEELKTMNKMNESGGPVYLAEILNETSTTANISYYAKIIREKYKLRSIIITSQEAIENAYLLKDSSEIIETISENNFKLTETVNQNKPESTKNLINDVIKEMEERSKNNKPIGVLSGFTQIDQVIGGFQPGTMTVLAARPGHGKSLLSLSFAKNANNNGDKSAIFTLEMPKRELLYRLLSQETGIPMKILKTGKFNPELWLKVSIAAQKIKTLDLIIDDSTSLDFFQIKSKIRELKRKHNLKQVIVDYIGLMATPKGTDRREGLEFISRGFKSLAKELNISIIVLSQLNREVDKTLSKEPELSHLRDTGSLEQDADIVMFIMRPELYNLKSKDGGFKKGAHIYIKKHRAGATDTLFFNFEGSSLTFSEPEIETMEDCF